MALEYEVTHVHCRCRTALKSSRVDEVFHICTWAGVTAGATVTTYQRHKVSSGVQAAAVSHESVLLQGQLLLLATPGIYS